MKVRVTPRALREAKRLKSWWVNNRDEVDLFDEELTAALNELLATPTIGAPYPSRFEISVRRVLMKKTNNHVYFTAHGNEVVILSVWGAPGNEGRSCNPGSSCCSSIPSTAKIGARAGHIEVHRRLRKQPPRRRDPRRIVGDLRDGATWHVQENASRGGTNASTELGRGGERRSGRKGAIVLHLPTLVLW